MLALADTTFQALILDTLACNIVYKEYYRDILDFLAITRITGILSTTLDILDIRAYIYNFCKLDFAVGLVEERNTKARHSVVVKAAAQY